MELLKPFIGLVPQAAHVADVVAPPYDVISSAQARVLAADNPYSFLHISKPEIDCDPAINPHDPQVYLKGAQNLQQLCHDAVLHTVATPGFYIYRIKNAHHQQTGIVALFSIEAYRRNQIARHELTRPDKESDRVNHLAQLKTQTSPVLLSYQATDETRAALQAVTSAAEADYVVDYQGYQHQFWIVADADKNQALSQVFNQLEKLYIADGHHRSAAASRVAESENLDYFLGALFPSDELRILSYNRIVDTIAPYNPQTFLSAVREVMTVHPIEQPSEPTQANHIHMYLAQQWYLLEKKNFSGLSVDLLHKHLLEPLLKLTDPRKDPRIHFVGGTSPLTTLAQQVDQQPHAVAFALYPTAMQDLFATADANKTMPPKSTWFEPKLLDGFVSCAY